MNSGTQTWGSSANSTAWPSGGLRTALEALTLPLRPGDVKLHIDLNPVPCLHIVGDLNRRTAVTVKQAVRDAVSRPGGRWRIDLSRVARWDAEGLATLVHALDLSELNGRELQLVAPPPGLRAIIERAQLHRLFWIVDETSDV